MNNYKCTHPDHVEGTTCIDRAIGCSRECQCCMGDLASGDPPWHATEGHSTPDPESDDKNA